MSAETKAAMEAAIAAHLADGDNDSILTGYVLKATSVSMGDEVGTTCSQWEHSDDQPVHVTLGLAEALHIDVRNWYDGVMTFAISAEDDEDD